jgi:hypothetical protein
MTSVAFTPLRRSTFPVNPDGTDPRCVAFSSHLSASLVCESSISPRICRPHYVADSPPVPAPNIARPCHFAHRTSR